MIFGYVLLDGFNSKVNVLTVILQIKPISL